MARPRTHEVYFEQWLVWVRLHGGGFGKFSPDELVEFQRVNPASYELLNLAQGWVSGLPLRANSKARAYSTLRSFFLHNRAVLPSDPSFKISSEIPGVRGDLSAEELRRIVETCNPLYRAVFLSMFQGGMGSAELLFWSSHGLEDVRSQLRENRRFIRVDLPGRKQYRNKRPYYTFLGRDARDALDQYLRHEEGDGKNLFLNAVGRPLTYMGLLDYWEKRLERLGLIREYLHTRTARYGKNMHEMRDLFRTRWQKSGADPLCAEFQMGHVVDPLGYNKAMSDRYYVETQYRTAEKWLNIVSEDPEKMSMSEVQERDQMLEEHYGKAIGLLQKQVAYLVEQLEKKP